MAQPQHTRIDSHGSGSFYEKYVDSRVKQRPIAVPGDELRVLPPALDFGSYPIPNFNRFSDFTSDLFPNFVVSTAKQVPQGGIDGSSPRLIVFDFPQALPFNAIDVDLHVIYRGALGTESEGIAIGFKHISEPTFFNFDNFADCQLDSTCAPGECGDRQATSLPFPGGIEVVAAENLPAGGYARAAFLTDYTKKERLTGGFDYVAVNQDLPGPALDGIPGEVMTEGVNIRGAMYQSRQVLGGSMLSWQSARRYNPDNCSTPECYYAWATSCPMITTPPHAVTVYPSFWTVPQ